MASRHDIIHIDFEANAGKVSPALKAIQNSAADTRKAVQGLEQELANLEKAGADKTAIEAKRKQLNALNRDVKSLQQAEREYVKGIGTLDKAIKAFNDGTLSQMSAAFQKASYNAAKLAQTKLVPADKDYKKSMEELNALMQRNMENMAKARMQTDDLLKAIEGGGKVSATWLRQEKQNLEELLDVIPRGTAEWKQYNDQLTKIKDYTQTLSETERRLAGEIVDANDARRMANQLTKEGADAAKREREAAEAIIAAQDKKIEKLEQMRQKHLENAQALSKQVADEANDIELKKQAIAELEKQVAAENTASANKKQSTEAQKASEEAQATATAKITEAETLYNQKMETRIQKEKELKEIQGRGISDDPHLKQLQEEIAKLEELIAVSDKYKKQFAKMSDKAYDEGYMGKSGPTDDERKYVWLAQDYLKRAYYDRFSANFHKLGIRKPGDLGYEEDAAASDRVAKGIVQNAQENLRRAIYREIQDGRFTSATMERDIESFRGLMQKAAREAGNGNLKDDPEYNTYKYIIAQMEKYLEVAKQVEAERAKIAGGSQFLELAREKDVLSNEPQEGLIRQKESREWKEATSGSDAINRRKEEERVATEALAKAQDEERQAIARLDEEKKKSAEQTQTATQATKQSTEATSEAAKQLATAKTELEGMEATHEKHIGELQKENQAIQQQEDLIKQEADTMQEAELKKAQNQELTVKRMEEIVAMLEKENHDTIPANTKKWQENQQEIDRLNEKIKEAKNEWMSYAEAEKYAESIGTDGFIATSDQLQKATQSLTRYKDTLIKTIQQKRDDGKATAEEEAELKKVEAELKKMKFEMDNANMSSKRMHEILKDPKSAKNIEELSAAIKRSTQELKLMEETIGKDNAKYKEMAEQTKKATIEQKNMEAQFKASSSAFEKAWSRLKTYVGLYVGAAVAMQKIVATMGDLMELSDKMGEVRKTTGFTADEVGRLSDNLKKLDVRTSLTSLMELSSLAGSVGLKTQQDVQGFTEAANQLMIALPEMGNESARTLIKIAQATGDLQKNNNDVRETLEKVGSTIIALRANSASAAGPITDFVSRVGAVGAQAGISIDQIAALGSTIDALGGRVEMSATALSRMIPAIRNNSYAIANSIGVTESYLKSLSAMDQMVLIFQKLRDSIKGINTETEEGQQQMADNIEAVLGKNAVMAEVMKDLNQQGARAGIVFGLLSQNVDELQKQLGIAGDAYKDNIALQEEFNKMNDTTAAKWARLKNQLEEMFVSDSMQRFLGGIIDGLRKIVDLISMDGPLGSAIRFLIVSATLFRVKWLEAIGDALMAFGNWILAQTQATAATTAETAATTANTAAKTANAAATTTLAAATEGAAVKTNIFAAAWGKMDKAMKANIIGLVAAAVLWLGTSLYNSARRAREAAKQIDVLAEAEKKAKEESVKERAELEKLYKVTQDQTNSMEERKKALRDMVGDEKYKEYYENLSTESELTTAAASAYKELSEQILATARARALDAKAEELQRKRIELEDQKREKQEWEDENRAEYRKNKQAYEEQKKYVDEATRGAAGYAEAGIAQRGAAAMKPGIIDEFEGSIRERNRIDGEIAQIDKDIERLQKQVSSIKPQTTEGGTAGGGGGGNNPYGNFNRVTSPYGDWDTDSLVARRKEMLERVRSLANGADVQKVLSEDAKFISEAVRKNIKTTKDAIEWYNAERLKIQEALHEKHLTNTGDWMDPKKGSKKASKLVQDEMKYYLDELDAYYTERKAKIQEARNDEQISEAEAWRRNIQVESEWQHRRAELQQLYAKKAEKVTQEEQDAIFEILSDRTDESIDYIKKDIEGTVKFIEKVGKEKGNPAMECILDDLDLGIEKALLRQQNAIGKQMKFIEDTLAKERPYDGITKSLQENLVKMGILTADLADEQRDAAEELKRTAFLLGEAENAYTLTVEDMMRRIADAGMKAWADELEKNPAMQQALMAQLRKTYDEIQAAIKREATLIKKQVDIWWADIAPGADQSRKDTFERALSQMGLLEDSVKRANQLIGAVQASERVADKLAIKQMQIRLAMQATYYNKMREVGLLRIKQLKDAGKLEDAEHLQKSLNLALTQEQVKLDEQRVAIANKLEESQNRLYTELREWGGLLSSSLQSVFEASNAGMGEYYNEMAKLRLTGSNGKGGTYIVIDNAGTSEAEAHYETLSDEEYLKRMQEIEAQNAKSDAWKKVMDDIANKMNDSITDWMNAWLQNQSIDMNTESINVNTEAEKANTDAVNALTQMFGEMKGSGGAGISIDGSGMAGVGEALAERLQGKGGEEGKIPSVEVEGLYREGSPAYMPDGYQAPIMDWNTAEAPGSAAGWAEQLQQRGEASAELTNQLLEQQKKIVNSQTQGDQKMAKSAQSAFAKMTQAANLYGVAYQAMSNDNLDTAQKFEMIALQAVGNAAIKGLEVALTGGTAETATQMPAAAAKSTAQAGPFMGPVLFGILSALVGGLMGFATSQVAKSKSEIAQVTGAKVNAGRLATGMLTYKEGNVNEFTDPQSLTPGRQYNVDAADGRTYRAKYMGKNAKTHITTGPEFHLVGEAGREAIIDAKTTRNIQMNDPAIWHAIQTLYNGGSMSHYRPRRGVRGFADGNLDDFASMDNGQLTIDNGMDMAAMTDALNRQNELQAALLQRLSEPFEAYVSPYGKRGIVNGYDQYKKEAQRHGQKYID